MLIDLLLLLLLDIWIKETGQILELGTEPFEPFANIAESLIFRKFEQTFLDASTAGGHATIVG